MVALALAAVPVALANPPPGEYTYQQALKLGIASPREFQRPPGVPVCPPLEDPFPGLPDVAAIPPNAPSCWRPPEEQGLVFLVLAPGDPGFGSFFAPTTDAPTGEAIHPAIASWGFSPLALLGVYLETVRK